MTLTLEVFLGSKLCVIFGGHSTMLLKLNAITAAIRGQISLNMRQITCMHFGQISCFGDIYLDLFGHIRN